MNKTFAMYFPGTDGDDTPGIPGESFTEEHGVSGGTPLITTSEHEDRFLFIHTMSCPLFVCRKTRHSLASSTASTTTKTPGCERRPLCGCGDHPTATKYHTIRRSPRDGATGRDAGATLSLTRVVKAPARNYVTLHAQGVAGRGRIDACACK